MSYRILIVDDEIEVASMLQRFLQRRSYIADYCLDGAEAMRMAESQPDLILLDINMPQIDGIEVCRAIRDRVSCPILFLTARDQDADKVEGFSAGGDDYIVKPFSLPELEARVQAHLRREERHRGETAVKFSGDLTIDFAGRRLSYQGSSIALTKKEFDIVALLAQNPGQIFDRERTVL